jgi:hypothetical protein
MQPLACPDPAHFDVLDHHPYAVGSPYTPALNPDDVSIPDLAKLERPLAVAERTGRALPAGTKPIWATEVSYDSDPPDPQAVPMATFERWTAQTLYELWSAGVSLVTWYLIQDQPPVPSYADSYQSGMYFLDGRVKPAQRAFRFPLVVDRRGAGEPIVWTRVPASGTLVIEGFVGGRWVAVLRTSVTRHEVVERHLPASTRRGLPRDRRQPVKSRMAVVSRHRRTPRARGAGRHRASGRGKAAHSRPRRRTAERTLSPLAWGAGGPVSSTRTKPPHRDRQFDSRP